MKRGIMMNQDKIGKFIAECRKDKNLTQEQLAEKIGVSKNAVSKWERGLNLPDASLMPELCKILNITLNELFSGEKIPDNKYKEVADNNLLSALEESVFTVKDKVDYFKRKWERDHFFESIVVTIIIVVFVIYGFIKDNGLQYIFMLIGLVSGMIENHRKMAYVERNVYGNRSDITIEEFRNALSRLKESKEILNGFPTKKEAVDFLIQETGLSKQECSEAYDVLIKLDLDKEMD